MKIKKLTTEDIDRLVEIHVSSLPDDLLPSLGRSFLARYFFPIVLASANTIAIGAYSDDDLLTGFVIFVDNSRQLTSKLIKRSKYYLIANCIKKLFVNPKFFKKIIQFLSPVRRKVLPNININSYPELYLIATHENYQGMGYGSQLVKAGLQLLKTNNKKACIVKTSSCRAKKFYMNLGFREVGQEFRSSSDFQILHVTMS